MNTWRKGFLQMLKKARWGAAYGAGPATMSKVFPNYDESRIMLILEAVKDIVPEPVYYERIYPLLRRTQAEAAALLLANVKYEGHLEKFTNKELADILTEQIWANLAAFSPAGLLVGEAIERLKELDNG